MLVFLIAYKYFGGTKEFLAFATDYKGWSNLTTTLANGFESKTGNFTSYLKAFADNYFNTNAIGNNFTFVVNALDNGHPVIATLWNNSSKADSHEVTIIGYTDAGDYRYYNSQTGNYTDRSSRDFDGLIEIKGKK